MRVLFWQNTKGGIIAVETINYNRFKESCEEFKSAFSDSFFSSGRLFCHPLLDGVIYTPCSPEEAKSNSMDICRMADMLLMSADGKEYLPFKIAEARKIAAENGTVYISNLLFKETFMAYDWMIDGKHDTLIISEEHMRKEGKNYAPVTPLTNVVQPFKKFTNHFLYKKGTLEEPAVLGDKEIKDRLDAHLKDALSSYVGTEYVGEPQFDLFDGKITMDTNESRCMELDKGINLADEFEKSMEPNVSAFKSGGIDFDMKKYMAAFFIAESEKCGIKTEEKDFASCETTEDMGKALRKLVSEKNGYGFKYTEPDAEKAEKLLRAAELGSPEGVKAQVSELLKIRPAFASVFNLARAASPADAENIETISDYWCSSALSAAELGEYLAKAYVPADCRSADGKLCCGGAKASVILEDLKNAAAKYKLKNVPAADELAAYCEEFEKQSRTYNGTVFATKEEMEKAVKNEKELADLCADLSALDEAELKKLRTYIYDMKLDKKTTGKYLLKIKLALNDCEKNQLKLLCTGVSLKNYDELAALKKKIKEGGFDEVVAAPYLAEINDGMLSAQLRELTDMFKTIPDAAAADKLEKDLASDRFDKMFKRHFTAKIASARDGFARTQISEICKDIETAAEKALEDISKKLDEVKCGDALKAPFRKQISQRFEILEKQAADKEFEGIATADKAKLDKMREVIKSGRFKAALTDKYAADIEKRTVELENAEFVKKCETIPQMDAKALAEIIVQLESEKYPEDIVKKYMPMTAEREKTLKKEELAQMCKDIASMDFAKLDALEAKLKDEKYAPDMTAGYFDSIKARRKVLYNAEADGLCKNIGNMQKPELAQLTEKLKNEKYDPEYTKKYFDEIDKRFNKIETDKLDSMCKNIEKLKKPELEKLTADISALGLRKENAAPYLEKIRKQEISLIKSQLESLCKNIPNTPRKELSKLREALTGDDFDKELTAKYIEQIDKRTAELIKKELADLCSNIAGSPKDKLMKMKLTISETPEYAEAGKPYVEQIESRLKAIDKAEFDKQMASIDKLDREALEKFEEDLENRKPSLDPKLYEASAAKCRERGEKLEKAELDKLTENIKNEDVKKLNEIKDKILEGDFTPEYTFPYIKRLDDEINDRHVKYFTKLTENINGMSRAELIVLLEKINKNEAHCPDDMLQRYIGKVNSKIREADSNILAQKCRNLGTTTEHQCFELIKDINEMDIDPETKKRFITQVELHITHLKTIERDGYVEKLKTLMADNSVTEAQFYVSGISKAFESSFIKIQNTYASTEQFELPLLIHMVTMGVPEDSFLLTLDQLYYQGKNGLGHIPVDQIERFEVKKSLFAATLHVVEKSGKSSELPCGIKKNL